MLKGSNGEYTYTHKTGVNFFIKALNNGLWKVSRIWDLKNPIHKDLPFYGFKNQEMSFQDAMVLLTNL